MEKVILCVGINRPILARYLHPRDGVCKYSLLLVGLSEGYTKEGVQRLYLMARDTNDEVTVKAFSYYRFLEIFDGETGEEFVDVPRWLGSVIAEKGGQQPASWPSEILSINVRPSPFETSRASDDWSFGVDRVSACNVDEIFFPQDAGRSLSRGFLEGRLRVKTFFRKYDQYFAPFHRPDEAFGQWLARGEMNIEIKEGTDALGVTQVYLRRVDRDALRLLRAKTHELREPELLRLLKFGELP